MFDRCFSLGSPFTVNVNGKESSRLRETITRERRAVDITHIGSQCELLLKIPGMLHFIMTSSSVIDNRDFLIREIFNDDVRMTISYIS
jgi:hypothetical protein